MDPIEEPESPGSVAAEEIRAQLRRLTESAGLRRSPQLQRLLRFLVEQAVAGRGERLKEFVLGVEVFGRPATYDPRLDSLVRVQAGRLRAALETYYEREGNGDEILIELPKGVYRPAFRRRKPAAGTTAPEPQREAALRGRHRWLAIGSVALLAAVTLGYQTRSSPSVAPAVRAPVIVVLPFENLSRSPEKQYLCFRLMDQLTAELAKREGVRVVPRMSSVGVISGADVRTMATKLNLDAAVEGSVRDLQDRLAVTIRLTDPVSRRPIWSETYERPDADMLSAEDQIAKQAAARVEEYLVQHRGEAAPLRRYSADPEANQLYWRGVYFRAPMGRTHWRQDLARCAGYLEQATQKDERFAVAFAALAEIYVSLGWERGGGPTTSAFFTQGRRAAARAIELDDSLAEAYGAMGAIQFFYDYDRVAAEKSFQRALALDPYNGRARMWYAYALVFQRRFEEAIAQARTAKELDPLSYVATTHLAVVMYFSRHYEDAMRLVAETQEVANTAPAHGLRGMILAAQKHYPEAIAEYEAGLRIAPHHAYLLGMLGNAYGLAGRKAEARRLLKEGGLEFEQGGLSDLKVSYIYLALGDRNRAFEHLERDYRQRDPELPYINSDPVFDSVRNDPRFVALVEKLGLAP